MNLTNKTFFDKLQVDEIFDFYDMPRLFSCKSPAGQTYLALNIGEDEISATWLYVAISAKRYDEAKRGQMDIRTIFTNAEDGLVYKLRSFTDLRDHDVKDLSVHQIDPTELPEEGEFLVDAEAEEDHKPMLSGGYEWQTVVQSGVQLGSVEKSCFFVPWDPKFLHVGTFKLLRDEYTAGEEQLAKAA